MNKVKSFNKKILAILMILLVIISTLLINKVVAYTTEMKSESDYPEIGTNVGDTAQTTYEDLVKYYSVLCCEHGRELASANKVILKVTYGTTDVTYDTGDLTANDKGMILFKHKVYSWNTDFSASSYTSYTWGRYEVVSNEIATPKEAYILAEMSAELEAGETLYYKILTNDEGERERYYGGVFESESYYLSERETIYYVNHTYVLETEEGNFLVGLGHDSEGNSYYVYKTYSDGSLREYGGSLEYGNNKNGVEVKLEGVHVDNVYYEFNGTISSPGTVAPGSGTLYLIDYDTVVNLDGTLYVCELEGGYSYIQIAWWSTEAGSKYNAIPVPPNTLAMEAEAFEAYILNITGKTSVSELNMIQTEQKYELHDDEGNVIDSGYITAPEIEYEPSWNEDSNQNGEIDVTDKATVSFDQEKNQYKVGPFSINYVKEGAHIESREPVDFACITGVTLNTNKGELELGKDWNFEWQYGERTEEDTSIYPNPNEVFYITINYIEGLTKIENFHFDFKFMNAGGLYSDLQGHYFLCEWGVHVGSAVTRWVDYDADGEYDEGEDRFWYRETWISLDKFEERREQQLAHAIIGVRWYDYREIEWESEITKHAYIELEKNVIDSEGQIVDVNDTFMFDIYIDRKDGNGLLYFENVSFEVVNGHGEATSSKITWEGEEAPDYKVVEVEYDVEKYENDGPWTGTLCDGITQNIVNIRAINVINEKTGRIRINKELLDTALESEIFTFDITVTGDFKYLGNTYTSEGEPLNFQVTVDSSTGWAWESEDFIWYDEAPKYEIKEIIPEGAEYELVGKIVNGGGELLEGEIITAIATNDSIRDGGYLEVLKEVENVTGTTEAFTFRLELTGNFKYGQEAVNGTKTIEFSVRAGEIWKSEYISWKDGEAPKYTIKEINIPIGYEFVSISNSNTTSTSLDDGLSGSMDSGHILLTAINDEIEQNEAYLEIIKKSETSVDSGSTGDDNVTGKEFKFKVKLEGNFTYNGVSYTDGTPYEFEVTVIADGESWKSDKITWTGETAPRYVVEEINIPENVEFVSISNDEKTITEKTSISGSFEKNKTIVITAINRGNVILNGGHLQIAKVVKNDDLLGRTFEFEVKLEGTFNYGSEVVNGEKTFNVSIVAGGEDWVSEPITWTGNTAPKYTVKEINIPEDAKFVSFSNRKETVETNRITGTIQDKAIVVVTATNDTDYIDEEGYLQIIKKAQTENISGQEFKFEVTINGTFKYGDQEVDGSHTETVIVKADDLNGWTSPKITWRSNNIPTYTIKEVEIPEGVNLVSLSNGSQTVATNEISGVLKNKDTIIVTAINKKDVKVLYGRLQIEKTLYDSEGNEITGKEFIFDVTVGDTTFTVSINSGETWRSDLFSWLATEEAPYYNVVERNEDLYDVSYTNQSGQLTSEGSALVTVKVTNKYKDEHHGRLRINKEIILNDKIKEEDVTDSFYFLVTLKGSFKYKGVDYTDTTKRFEVILNEDIGWTWTSEEIYWYDEAPSYSIEEIDLPPNWTLVSMSENASGKLEDGMTTEVTCTNEWDYDTTIILTMELGGKVWDDTNRTSDKHTDAQENGLIDSEEPGIANVLVTVYRVVSDENGNVLARLGNALTYDENDNITLLENSSTYTDENGNWSFGSISVPAYLNDEEKASLKAKYGENSKVSYDVEFSYDGQTYEPTLYLATSNGDANSFKSASTSGRDAWLYDSMVIDDTSERKSFNSSFEVITGNEAMDVNGRTEGIAQGNNGSKELHYTSVNESSLTNADSTRKVSTLQTINEEGYIYDEMILNSRTSTGALTYPFDEQIHLENWDKETTDVYKVVKHYSATYNYMLSINLGLSEREATDTSLEKDLNTAMVVVNGKALKYKYNRAIDLDSEEYQDLLYKQLEVENQGIEYELGLYASDYYYRASVYDGTDTGAALEGYYTNTLNLPLDSTEMDVYLTYLISVHNESETYDLRINKLADYYDSNLELIKEQTYKYVQEINGTEVNAVTAVAEGSKAVYYTADNQEITTINVNWNDSDSLTGSDGVEYTKTTTDSLMNQTIAHGGRVDVYVTFRVEKDSINDAGIYDTVKLGKRYNLAEVESFTSYYSDSSENRWSNPGEVTGRVDKDSAPNNINIPSLNEKSYYEDDTDSAPSIKISLNESDRNVTGLAFEDAQTDKIEYEQYVGDGIYNPDNGDKAIKDMKTEIVEILRIPQADGTYKEYEFEWPTNEPIAELGNKTISELTGFNQEVVTNGYGEYVFNSIPAGNYIVRFVYGDDDRVMLTGNSGELEVYNGQDYKSTAYQIGFESITDTNANGYVDNEWHDLTNTDLSNTRVSDVRDNEARRLYITSKSQTLTYENTSVLDTADNQNADHTGLFGDFDSAEVSSNGPVYGDGYYMYADTAKLNLSIENLYEIASGAPNTSLTTTNVGGLEVSMIDGDAVVNGVGVGTTNFNYTIKNIDCGIEERSKTALVLDKQIKEMILRTSDGQVILDAVYDIYYEVKDNRIIASVELNETASVGYDKIAGLNRSNSSQGYRYIMAEGQILQGTTLEVKYQITAFNISETDRTSSLLKPLWESVNSAATEADGANIINNVVAKLSTSTYNANGKVYNGEAIEYGMYFGSIYYQGRDGNTTDEVVETKVRQLIDYVDNDAVFADSLNINKDQAWSNTTIEYLLENGLLDPSVVQIIDSAGNITGETRADREATAGERYSIIDEQYQEYITEIRNNLILNNDSSDDMDGGNPGLIKYLSPYAVTNNLDQSSAKITLYISRYFASEDDTSDIDNLAEIIKTENTVGRRDVKAVAGNVNPFALDDTATPIGVYAASKLERDASATELITLSPPTGMDSTENRTTQIIVVVLIATMILAAGIILIKKKVLDKE